MIGQLHVMLRRHLNGQFSRLLDTVLKNDIRVFEHTAEWFLQQLAPNVRGLHGPILHPVQR
jgi:hypothetical protein